MRRREANEGACGCPLGRDRLDIHRSTESHNIDSDACHHRGSSRVIVITIGIGIRQTTSYPDPRRNRARQSSCRAKCYMTKHTSASHLTEKSRHTPNDPTVVELDVEDVARVAPAELAHHLARVQVPDLDRLVVAPAHEPPAPRVERQRAHEEVVPGQRPQACASVRVPHLDLAVVGAGDDEVLLHKRKSQKEGSDSGDEGRTLNSMQARPRSWPSNVRRRAPVTTSQRIILPSPLALTTLFPCSPTAFTGPSCPRSVQCKLSVWRSQTRMRASLELERKKSVPSRVEQPWRRG